MLAAFLGCLLISAARPSTINTTISARRTIFWCVADVRPGETLMCGVGQAFGAGILHGHHAGSGRFAEDGIDGNLTFRVVPAASNNGHTSAAPPVIILPAMLSPSGDAVSAEIPVNAPSGAFTVQLASAATGGWMSNVYG